MNSDTTAGDCGTQRPDGISQWNGVPADGRACTWLHYRRETAGPVFQHGYCGERIPD